MSTNDDTRFKQEFKEGLDKAVELDRNDLLTKLVGVLRDITYEPLGKKKDDPLHNK